MLCGFELLFILEELVHVTQTTGKSDDRIRLKVKVEHVHHLYIVYKLIRIFLNSMHKIIIF